MTCGIYKIENKLNGKVYIGQSVNITKRWINHKNNYITGKSKFYKAIQEFGLDNFEWSIIEECTKEELEDKEKYWIDFYNSIEDGYNTIYGSLYLNHFRKLTEREYNNVIQDLIENKLSLQDISNKYNITISYLYQINNGENTKGKEEGLIYPLRKLLIHKNDFSKIIKENLNNIIKDLKNIDISIKEIGKKYNLNDSEIYKINSGINYRQDKYNYPIRKLNSPLTKEQAEEIKILLKDTNLSYKEIGLKYNKSNDVIININTGKTFYDEKIKYPIRIINKIPHFLTEEEINRIINLLVVTSIPITKIAKEIGVCDKSIRLINNGINHKKDNFIYPLRLNKEKNIELL